MIIKNEGPASVLGLFSSEDTCAWCHIPQAKDVALKRCKGCAVVLYCSKECQTVAWPSHKRVCTSRSAHKVAPIYTGLGYATPAELGIAATCWTEAHKLTLLMVANIAFELNGGGADAVLNAQRAVVFELAPPSGRSDGTPATTFTINFVALAERDAMLHQWTPSAIADRASVLRALRAACPRPDLIGVVPLSLRFQDSKIMFCMTMPLYRRQGGGGTVDERTANALERLMQTCMAALIANGIVTRIPADVDQKMPEFARLVQQGKSWAMAPYASRAMVPALEIRTRYSDEGFAAYHRLWPFSSLLTNVSR